MSKNFRSLPEEFVSRVKKFKNILHEVQLTPLDETLDLLCRDVSPMDELLIWENIAHNYLFITKEFPQMSIEDKKKIFGALLTATTHLTTPEV